jgi:hypothetical protein
VFRNQAFAGVHVGNDDPGVAGGAEFDQNKFVDLKFRNTGDYGIYLNNSMLDKWLCLHCEFEGQKKAGISVKFNNLIHGAVIGCSFRQIDGPGLDFMGGNPLYGFRPYIVMVEQCEFTECGNETQPAVDQGYGELMSFTRCRIVTRERRIKCGYIGSAQHYEDVEIDVNLADGSPAMVLRAVRNGATARVNGHILRNVRANGPVSFINDANDQNDLFRRTMVERLKRAPELNWDVNPAAHELAPANGWTHPFLLYQCRFGDRETAYSLLRADVDNRKVVQEIDLSPLHGPIQEGR